MKKTGIWIVLGLIGLAAATGAGYWLGMKRTEPVEMSVTPTQAERKILYYRNPMGLPDTSPEPKKDSMGMDYIPVYADEASAAPAAAQGERKILYYRNPMGLPDTSPVPKQDSMGMDYIPVYADEVAQPGQISISPDKVQKLGVRTEPAVLRELARMVRAVGQFQVDERRLHTVTAKFEGYIEHLSVNATGQPVRRGQALMQVYSPELVAAQEEYLIAWKGRETLASGTEESLTGVGQLAEGALKRLRNWDISDTQLQRLQQEGKATRTLTLYSPANGVVLEKTAVAGMRFMPGEPLFKIADLSTIWLIADVFEQDLAQVRIGQPVKIVVDAYPEKEFGGKIAYIYPTVVPETRTAKVRVELANPGGLLKPDMYANVQLDAGDGKARVLTVPDSAVIDSGTRQVVLVQRAEGLFEPREVRLGQRGDGYAEVLQGVAEGEQVVVRANFLIDAESNLRAALGGFGESAPAPASVPGHEGH
jgi:Cu(I)/Ag(I) efflux system membrane fusion protein